MQGPPALFGMIWGVFTGGDMLGRWVGAGLSDRSVDPVGLS